MTVLNKKWVFVECQSEKGRELNCEDDSVFTEDNEQVIGCSEWMRCDKETFMHIVELHNNSLGSVPNDRIEATARTTKTKLDTEYANNAKT